MNSSPFSIILAALLLAPVAFAQSNSPAPKQAAGAPIGGAQGNGAQRDTRAKPGTSGSQVNGSGATGSAPTAIPAATNPQEEPQRPKTVILDSSATSSGVLETDGH